MEGDGHSLPPPATARSEEPRGVTRPMSGWSFASAWDLCPSDMGFVNVVDLPAEEGDGRSGVPTRSLSLCWHPIPTKGVQPAHCRDAVKGALGEAHRVDGDGCVERGVAAGVGAVVNGHAEAVDVDGACGRQQRDGSRRKGAPSRWRLCVILSSVVLEGCSRGGFEGRGWGDGLNGTRRDESTRGHAVIKTRKWQLRDNSLRVALNRGLDSQSTGSDGRCRSAAQHVYLLCSRHRHRRLHAIAATAVGRHAFERVDMGGRCAGDAGDAAAVLKGLLLEPVANLGKGPCPEEVILGHLPPARRGSRTGGTRLAFVFFHMHGAACGRALRLAFRNS